MFCFYFRKILWKAKTFEGRKRSNPKLEVGVDIKLSEYDSTLHFMARKLKDWDIINSCGIGVY